jgi:hypothetical protein
MSRSLEHSIISIGIGPSERACRISKPSNFKVPTSNAGGSHQFAEQLRNRLRVRVLGKDFGVAALQRHQFAAGVAVIEDEALGEVGIWKVGHRSGYLNG